MENKQENRDKHVLAEKKITDIIFEGLYLFSKNYGKIILPFMIFLTLSNFLIILCSSQLEWYVNTLYIEIEPLLVKFFEMNTETLTETDLFMILGFELISLLLEFLQGFIGAFFTTLSMILVSSYLYKKYTRNDEINETIINKKMILALLLIGCAVPFGYFMIFIIPGIILFCFFIFIIFTYNLKGVENPVKEARLIAKGSMLKIVIVFSFCVLITLLVNSLYQNILNMIWPVDKPLYDLWLDPYNRNYGMLFLYNLTRDVVGILLAPLFISLLTVLFASSKARKDLGLTNRNYYPQSLRQTRYPHYYRESRYSQDESDPARTQKVINRDEGYFCPFCGERIGTIKKFCPNCGESLKGLNL